MSEESLSSRTIGKCDSIGDNAYYYLRASACIGRESARIRFS